jgi:hypothetical protein
MKKHLLYTLFALIAVTSCAKDEFYVGDIYNLIPESLVIKENAGLKLENYIVKDQVNVNVKLPSQGVYRIRIEDISGKVVSQEKITAAQGDNILKVYVNALPKSSYTLKVTTEFNQKIGDQIFSKI